MMEFKYAALEPDKVYHIYNRANGSEKLFLSEENYHFFLRQFQKYIQDYVEVYCYCLMPNHFHLLLKVKNQKDLDYTDIRLLSDTEYSLFLSKKFSNLFSSYTQAFNKMYQRKGSLFMKPFKRKLVNEREYLIKLIHYIHFNPVKASLVNHPKEWKHCSYRSILTNDSSLVLAERVMSYFEDRQNFIYFHKASPREGGLRFLGS